MKKRLLSILLTLCMILCIMPTSVFAEGETAKKSEQSRNWSTRWQTVPWM